MSDASSLPTVLTPEEQQELLQALTVKTSTDPRDQMMVKVMLWAGLRPGEVRNLKTHHLRFNRNGFRVPSPRPFAYRQLSFDELPNGPSLSEEWKQWWEDEEREDFHLDSGDSEYVFLTDEENKVHGRHVRKKVTIYAGRAGLSKPINPITLRHTFGVEFYKDRQDLDQVMKIMGFKNRSSARKYEQLAQRFVEGKDPDPQDE